MPASTFSANWGSLFTLNTLNVRDRWDFRPCLCQIRRTLFSLSPAALAMPHVFQCVALLVFFRVVFRPLPGFRRARSWESFPVVVRLYRVPLNHCQETGSACALPSPA